MRFLIALYSLVMLPFMVMWVAIMVVMHGIMDWIAKIRKNYSPEDLHRSPDTSKVTVVIPTWNGKELLDMCLPPLIAALRERDDIIVVDNASEDGTKEHLAATFPRVKVLRLEQNGGFRGGCNAGMEAADSDIILFLNNDMVVEPDFLAPLLKPFEYSAKLFAVTSQIYFMDKEKRREETGLTKAELQYGYLRPGHSVPKDKALYPVLYAGGGSSAFDRRKLMILGGFDSLYDPFYVEDLDLSYKAWMRNWPSVMAPASIVHHKHRGTIGTHFRRSYIEQTVQRNNLLFSWRNFGYRRFLWHCIWVVPFILRSSTRTHSALLIRAFWKAVLRYPEALKGRLAILRNRQLSDDQIVAISRSMMNFCQQYPEYASYLPQTEPRVLMVSPYSPAPPSHGGAVRMYHLLKQLAHQCDLHVLSFTENVEEETALEQMAATLASVHYMRRDGRGHRRLFSLHPNSISEFYYPQFARKIQEIVDEECIQIVQYEYTQMAQYVVLLKDAIPVVTEHDVSALGVARRSLQVKGLKKLKTELSLSAMFLFERTMLGKSARVYSVTPQEGSVLRDVFHLDNVCDTVPSGADVSGIPRIAKVCASKQPRLLFIGSFRHEPNVEGYLYFHREILPIIRRTLPDIKVCVVGPSAPDEIKSCASENVEVLGFVENLEDVYATADVVICPILSGAGVRIKLLECMAYGIPFVSTTMGAEGLLGQAGMHYVVADGPEEFSAQVCRLLSDSERWKKISDNGYELVMQHYAWNKLSDNLLSDYKQVIQEVLL